MDPIRVQDLLSGTLSSSVASELNSIISSDSASIFTFSRFFLSLIPARSTDFPAFSSLLSSLSFTADPSLKSIFIDALYFRAIEPNQSEVCAFAAHLAIVEFLDPAVHLRRILSILRSAQSFSTLQFAQLLYAVPVALGNADRGVYAEIIGELGARAASPGADDDAGLLEALYGSRESKLFGDVLEGFAADSPVGLDRLLNGSRTLQPTLEAPASVLTFQPPWICVAAFFGAMKCVEGLCKLGFDIAACDDEGRNVACFAAMSGSLELLKWLRGKVDFGGTLVSAVEFWRFEVVDWLRGIGIGAEPALSAAALAAAARVNSVRAVTTLREMGVSAQVRDEVLFEFIMNGHRFILQLRMTRARCWNYYWLFRIMTVIRPTWRERLLSIVRQKRAMLNASAGS
jgi:hypothetical protein